MASEREIEAVNIESLRLIAEEFRKAEAPFKERGDHRGLGIGARAYCVEQAIAEIERSRAASPPPPASLTEEEAMTVNLFLRDLKKGAFGKAMESFSDVRVILSRFTKRSMSDE